MDIGILGPLVVRGVGGDAAPTAPKPRQVLALLAVAVDRGVSMGTLIDEVWECWPPSSAVTAVQTYVSQLRRALAKALQVTPSEVVRDVLPFTGQGYRLVPGAGAQDVKAFMHFANAGREALAEQDNVRAAALLRRALQLWRGPVLADVRLGPHLLMHRTSLDEYRVATIERRVEADLRLGRHHELVGELCSLVLKHPLHENLRSQFMLALYRAGRTADAIGTYETFRKELLAELSVPPSRRIRELRQSILLADPRLESETQSRLFRLELTQVLEPAH